MAGMSCTLLHKPTLHGDAALSLLLSLQFCCVFIIPLLLCVVVASHHALSLT